MTRCKALVRGGSRRCRRQALNGSRFCSIHGETRSLRAGRTRPRSSRSSVRGRAPRAPPGTTGASYPSSLSPELNIDVGRHMESNLNFNWGGLGTMYVQAVKRNAADGAKALVGSQYINKFTPSPHVNWVYRRFPAVIAASGGFRSARFAYSVFHPTSGDLAQGNFPGTDEPILL